MIEEELFRYDVKDDERGLTVKDFNADEQPREKALRLGCEALSTAELWAIILRAGLPGKPITNICSEMMRVSEGSLLQLDRKDTDSLTHIPGVGPVKALQIKAVFELAKRYLNERPQSTPVISTPDQIYEEMRFLIGNLPHEEIWIIFLSRKNAIIAKERFSVGSAVASVFDLKQIIKRALLLDAQALVMCHNHPSGNMRPSPQDEDITRRLLNGCKQMELSLLDHVIITAGGYYSFRENGRVF